MAAVLQQLKALLFGKQIMSCQHQDLINNFPLPV